MTPTHIHRVPQAALLALLSLLVITPRASGEHAAKPAASPKSGPKQAAHAPSSPASGVGAIGAGMSNLIPGMPHYVQPDQYSADLVIKTTEGKDMVMHRSVDGGRVRTDIVTEGQTIAMIELGDDKGTSVTLMPKEKRGFKQTRAALESLTPEAMTKAEDTKTEEKKGEAPPKPEGTIEDLGEESLDGHAARKIRMTSEGGSALGWFDKATGAPLKMESEVEGKKASIEWKNMKPGPQPEAVFEVPKGYDVMDMDAMVAQMKSMKGMPGMGGTGMLGALGGMGGVPGMGGLGGGVKGMAGNMAGNFGSQMGSSLGGTLGASLGGPLGAMAGQYLGGRIGGMIGRKAADAVIPGK